MRFLAFLFRNCKKYAGPRVKVTVIINGEKVWTSMN